MYNIKNRTRRYVLLQARKFMPPGQHYRPVGQVGGPWRKTTQPEMNTITYFSIPGSDQMLAEKKMGVRVYTWASGKKPLFRKVEKLMFHEQGWTVLY